MRTIVPEKIIRIIEDIDTEGHVPLTRLTVLEKWFEHPGRLPAFGLWIARRAAARKGKAKGEAGALLDKARALLGSSASGASLFQRIDPMSARRLHYQTQAFHNEFEKQEWGPVRVIHCRAILLVEQGLALHTGFTRQPSDGYRLAADWAQNYHPQYGTDLNGPSRGKLQELVSHMFAVEALEDNENQPRTEEV